MVVSFFLSMYYNVINAWAFWYLFHSFQVSGQAGRREQDGARRAGHRRGQAGGYGQSSAVTDVWPVSVGIFSLSGPQ